MPKIIDKTDKTDLRILKKLQEDGRVSNLELSRLIGLSPAPTLERVKRLERSGFIKGYHADVNANDLGMGVMTIMLVRISRSKRNAVQNFIKEIQQIKEVVECYHVTGEADYALKIMAKDMASYEKLAVEQIGSIPGISNMQTMVILSTIKKSKVLPIQYDSL